MNIEKKITKPIERVTINDQFKDKLAALTEQANAALQGIANVTKSDLINLFLDEHPVELSLKQIERLKTTHIDQVKYAFWIASRLKAARDAGEIVTLNDLLKQIQPVVTGVGLVQKKRRGRKRKDEANKIETQALDQVPENDDAETA